MNAPLQKQIILHIFDILGIIKSSTFTTGFIESIISDKFLLDKKIAFDTEDGGKERNVWAATGKIEGSEIRIMIADISDTVPEYILLVQMDSFYPCAIRLSSEDNDFGSMFFNIQNNEWIALSTSYQAKMLIGFEHLTEVLINWQKSGNFMDMYKTIIGFLTFYENTNL